jgi:hypothetical protein
MTSKSSQVSLRRRRSKGTIAGFADDAPAPQATPEGNGEIVGPSEHAGGSMGGSASSGQGNQPQHNNDLNPVPVPARPCHSARLALLVSQNAIRMGARTQLGLCPPGRARRGLQTALRQRSRSNNRTTLVRRTGSQSNTDTGGYYGLEKMLGAESLDDYANQEEDFLLNTNTFDVESDEEASSGDEDELNNIQDLLNEDDSPSLDDEKKYINLREPLFTPIGAESLANSNGGRMSSIANSGSGKLPFNRRKLRYFDAVTAPEKMAARAYLTKETRKSKQRDVVLLARHLRKMQRQERRRMKQERGGALDDTDFSDQENDDPREKGLISGCVSQFEQSMTPAMSAALVMESLSLNQLESVEGMAKCYDGIVAAGVALLDANVNDPSSPSSQDSNSLRTRSEIMAALTPLLITSLEQPSGEVFLNLAKLRRMCGTPRYQRRFIQRTAPSLIRPPRGAIWCLRHQNDMEPILAAAELIFDSAAEIFSKGWYDRGQLLLADSKRAETLNTAAMQLRNLSSEVHDSLTLGGLSSHGHGVWRGNKFKHGKDNSKSSSEPLAEWEVIAVDRQIRVSISSIISTDWSRVVVHRDSEINKSYGRNRSALARKNSYPGDMSPKSIVTSPMSPARPSSAKTHVSSPGPNHPPSGPPAQPIFAENAFPTSFSPAVDTQLAAERSISPNFSSAPKSPTTPSRSGMDEIDYSGFPPAGQTPPRSPIPRDFYGETTSLIPPVTPTVMSPSSPRRGKSLIGGALFLKESISNQTAPTSTNPQAAGEKPSDIVAHRPVSSFVSSTSSVTSSVTGGAQPAHYRMLTSTAAERKRTVAACRALRAQITRFEDAFIQLHGRPPKGAGERSPLSTTYAQYREWKRAIRADAACRIQALFRGAMARWMLLGSNNSRITRVVMTKAGRLSDVGNSAQSSGQDNVLKQLSIPAEIGELEPDGNAVPGSGPMGPSSGEKTYNDGADIFLGQGQSSGGQSLPPQWGNQVVRRRSGSNERPPHDSFSGSSPTSNKPFSSPSGSVSSANSSDIMGMLPLSDLQARKRDLKQQLKHYDMNFARKHGRMPVKSEKEPIRNLYENYNALKSQITTMELDGRTMAMLPLIMQQQLQQQQQPPVLPQRTVSPTSGPESGDESPTMGLRGKRKQLKSPIFDSISAASTTSTSTPSSGPPSQDLPALKVEKGKLHQMLRSYEKDFFKEHKRQVSSFTDIKPVASQYRRYKEIKKAISALQGGGDK